MSRLEIIRKIAFLDALEPPGAPLVGKDHEERERLIAELDHFDDTRWGAQKKMLRRDAHMGRGGIPLMRYDLDVDEASYRRLVSASWLLWRVAMDDYEMRHDPDKPKRRLQDNWNPGDIAYDYGDDAGVGLENWDEWWEEVYRAPPGRRWPEAVPRVPLYEVFFLVRAWWFKNTGKRTFGLTYDGTCREDFSASARLFLDIAQILDDRYTAEDCAIVYENCRR